MNCPPETPDAYVVGLAYYTSNSYIGFQLPRKYTYTSIAFVGTAAGSDDTLRITHRDGSRTTNLQEIGRHLAAYYTLTEELKEREFDSLVNRRVLKKPSISPEAIWSAVLGTLQRDEFDDWWISPARPLPFFDDRPLDIRYTGFRPDDDPDFIGEADAAVANLLRRTSDDRRGMSQHVYRNCMDFLDAVEADETDSPMRAMASPLDVWRFVHPYGVYVSRDPHRDRGVYARICCHCDWEPEHGLQLVFDGVGRLIRVSANDGDIHGWNGDGMIDEHGA
ncbi:MAG TPA: hypothetical protein VM555_02230 [Tahibacter sp.]|nr:hypothetical protein [Tahibacter sp.]